MTPRSDSDSMMRICDCRSAGNWSMMRSTVDAAVVVWSVPNTRCPVSAVSIAMATVSRSRSSPTSRMSGSSRSAARSAALNELGVRAHFALVDQALLVLVHELDRILDRDDVLVARPVDVIDHRAQRRRLARAGRSGDQHEPFVQLAQIQDVRRKPELLGGEDVGRDDAKHRAAPFAIGEHVGAEPGEARNLIGEIGVVLSLQTPGGSPPA